MEPNAGRRCTNAVQLLRAAMAAALACLLVACAAPAPTPRPPPSAAPLPTRVIHSGTTPVETGEPIALTDLSGRIVFDDFADVFAMDVDLVVLVDAARGVAVDDPLAVGRPVAVELGAGRIPGDHDDI